MQNILEKNSVSFNDKKTLSIFIESILQNEELLNIKKEYIKTFPLKEKKFDINVKNKYQQIGYALAEKKIISNAKIIYDLYRHLTKSDASEINYYKNQIEPLFKFIPVIIENDICYISNNSEKLVLGHLIYIPRKSVGKPKLNIITKQESISKQLNSKLTLSLVNKNRSDLTEYLCKNSFSIYSFVENKIRDKNTWEKVKGSKNIITRASAKFDENHVTICLHDPFENIIEIRGKYHISQIGNVKMSIDIFDTYYCDLDDAYFSFYFELDKGCQFQDFAHGNYKKKKFNHSAKLGSSFLVVDIDEEKEEIEEKKFIVYDNIDYLPKRVLALGQYFLQRDKNYLKFPTFENQSFESLKQKLEGLESKPMDLRIFKYKYFISMPILFDTPSVTTYKKRIEFYLQAIKRLEIENTYFAAQGKTLLEYEESINNKAFGTAIDEIANASHYILIIPKMKSKIENSTKALLELGVSIFLKRPTLILVHKDSLSFIPKGISSENVTIWQFSTLDSLNKLKINAFFQ